MFLKSTDFNFFVKIMGGNYVFCCSSHISFNPTSHLKEIIQPSPTPIPPDRILLHLSNKNILREIYRNIQIFAFKALQDCSSWASRNGAVQMLFLTPNRNMFAGKFVK